MTEPQNTTELLSLHVRALAQERAAKTELEDQIERAADMRQALLPTFVLRDALRVLADKLANARALIEPELDGIIDDGRLSQKTVTEYRQTHAEIAVELQLLIDKVRIMSEHRRWYVRRAECKRAITAREAKVRQIAIDTYMQRGASDRHPHENVTIRVSHVPTYDDSKALAWAIEKKLAIKLDKKAFDAIAKTNALPFVRIVETPKATISRDLAALLLDPFTDLDDELAGVFDEDDELPF